MAYVTEDGTVLKSEPWGRKLITFFMGVYHALFMFVTSLLNPIIGMLGPGDSSSQNSRYTRDFRPGSGPPRPPYRRLGRPNLGPAMNIPGGCGGCGCG
ncbi:selenoprotein K-like [Athalia rosae]|uniref:selenoprotein K-like n=1 Tax=Athalia rosae TaxID=37344 RepID=UPI000625E0F9|nr:selenoprotein K-like [Athalia rosae]